MRGHGNLKHRQGGMTAIGWLIVIAVVAFMSLFGIRLAPVYMEYFSVKSSLESLKEEEHSGVADLQKKFFRRLMINGVDRVERDHFNITRTRGVYLLEVEYEVVQPFVGNISFLVNFYDSVEVPAN